jgi:hypothetical protein
MTSNNRSTSPASCSRSACGSTNTSAQAEGGLPVRGATGADHLGGQLVRELHRHRPDTARGAVDQDGLAGL